MIFVKGWWRLKRRKVDTNHTILQRAYYRGWFLLGFIPLLIIRKWD